MADNYEITVWTRGIILDKEARDVVKALAQAGSLEGKFTQSFDNYVDLPDRVNVPIRKYARISDDEIEEKYLYENDNPNLVVVVEETLVKGVNILRGMKKGALVVNTRRSPEEILKFIPDKKPLKILATVDATGIAKSEVKAALGEMAKDRLTSEGAGEVFALGKGASAPLIGAAARASGVVKLETLEKIVADREGLKKGWSGATLVEL